MGRDAEIVDSGVAIVVDNAVTFERLVLALTVMLVDVMLG